MFPLAGDILSTVPVPLKRKTSDGGGGLGEDMTYWLEDTDDQPLVDTNGVQLVDTEG